VSGPGSNRVQKNYPPSGANRVQKRYPPAGANRTRKPTGGSSLTRGIDQVSTPHIFSSSLPRASKKTDGGDPVVHALGRAAGWLADQLASHMARQRRYEERYHLIYDLAHRNKTKLSGSTAEFVAHQQQRAQKRPH
jgi:hypothetical protein